MDRSRAALAVLLTALFLGSGWDLLLRWIPWGVNAPIWTFLFVAGVVWCAVRLGRASLPLLVVASALVGAAGIAWRDSPVLVGLDVALLVLLLPMLALHARGIRLTSTGLSHIAIALLTTVVQSVAGLFQLLLTDLEWHRLPRPVSFRGAGVFFRGVLIAIPALVLFGSLLISADPAFRRLILDLAVFDVQEVILHIVVTFVVAAVCAGFLRSLLFSGPAVSLSRPAFLSLPAAETQIALGLINLLFAAFVAVQFRYFFGGTATMGVASLSYSDYARRGFFELVWVVALALPMLLVLDWLVDKSGGSGAFRTSALIQVVLILVIAASAYRRMQLYRDEFGLTQLRLYTTAFMLWLGVLLVWFAATVLTGQRHRFAAGVLTSGVIAVVALHAINPDALIVRTNLARAAAGKRPFDAAYALTLSDDAVPALQNHPELRRAFAERPRPRGWRTWNLSRERARRLSQ
jgi:hypothetical protein